MLMGKEKVNNSTGELLPPTDELIDAVADRRVATVKKKSEQTLSNQTS